MNIVLGVVKDGKVELESPLPEGTPVEIRVVVDPCDEPPEGWDPELWQEMRAWHRASAEALALVERLAEEMPDNETR